MFQIQETKIRKTKFTSLVFNMKKEGIVPLKFLLELDLDQLKTLEKSLLDQLV